MSYKIGIHRYIVIGLCASVIAQLLPITVEAVPPNNSQITINMGKPTVWSLAQAHYLLANMRQNNRSLTVPLDSGALNPNAPNATRMEILRTFLGAEAQYSGVAGLQNKSVIEKYRDESNRRQTVQARLDQVTQQYLDAVRQRSELIRRKAKVDGTDANAEQRRKDLQEAIDQKTDERDALNAEMTALNGQLTTAPSLGNLNSTAPFNQTTLAGKEGDLDKIIDKIVDKASPRLSASTSLDNYVQMQYEVIAKQLTLLRDEVGPGERLIFLELPCDIYSVPKRDDDYVVQVEWKVKRYFGRNPSERYKKENHAETESPEQANPIMLDSIRQRTEAVRGMDWYVPLSAQSEFRVVDVIPRQSALNVNDVQAQTRGFALAAKFLTVFGFGGQVSYERQRTLYSQFMQQEVFASGYGKGLDRFGWTFGPTPGTKRLSPGVRTTYAIMSIPESAIAIELEPTAKIYRRDASPLDIAAMRQQSLTEPYQVLIPSEHTEGFWVDSIAYTPVRKGGRVTAVLGGRYFSPLTGVLVDGVPLKRAVSIAKNESDTTSLASATDAFGEYEYLNPKQVVLSFKMPDADYVGTPLITLVTPERTSAINYFTDIEVNYHEKSSLAKISTREPMFLSDFSLASLDVKDLHNGQLELRLMGTGLRSNAELFVDNAAVPVERKDVAFLSTSVCQAIIKPDDITRWKITYRVGTQEATLSYRSNVPTIDAIENPGTGKAEGPADGATIVTIRGKYLSDVRHVLFGEREATIVRTGDEVLFVRVPDGQEGSVHVVVTGNTKNGKELTNLSDFATAGKAIYKYTPSTKVNIPSTPSITAIENPTTGKAEGPADADVSVVIRGINLQDVEHVFFGRKEGEIMEHGSRVLFVRVPRGDEGGVPVRVQTAKGLTNIADFETTGKAIYKYTTSAGATASRPPEMQRDGQSARTLRDPIRAQKHKAKRARA